MPLAYMYMADIPRLSRRIVKHTSILQVGTSSYLQLKGFNLQHDAVMVKVGNVVSSRKGLRMFMLIRSMCVLVVITGATGNARQKSTRVALH
jgi:hypothetical protein